MPKQPAQSELPVSDVEYVFHKLGNLLTAILANVDLGIQTSKKDGAQRELLEIRKAALEACDLSTSFVEKLSNESRDEASVDQIVSHATRMLNRLLEPHGGKSEVLQVTRDSKTIKISWPLKPEAASPANESKASPNEPRHIHKVLVVEDNDTVRNVTARILKGLNRQSLLAGTGEEALAMFHKELANIDLVIIDIHLPQISGLDLYLELKKHKPKLPVIFATGFIDTEVREFMANVDPALVQVLQKPFSKEALLKKLDAMADVGS